MNATDSNVLALPTTHAAPGGAVALRMSVADMVMNFELMDRLERMADRMASGRTTVPAHLQDSPGDCMAIVLQSMSWGMSPYAVAQKTYMGPGKKIAYEAQLVSAAINNSGVLQGRLLVKPFGNWSKVGGKFKVLKNGDGKEYRKPDWTLADEEGLGVTVIGLLKGETEPRVMEVMLQQAQTRNSTLWASNPQQQLSYFAQQQWARLHAPDVILGVYTREELGDDPEPPRDMGMATVVERPTPTAPATTNGAPADLLEKAEAEAEKGVAAYASFFEGITKPERKTLVSEHARLKQVAIDADAKRTVDMPTKDSGAATGLSVAALEQRIIDCNDAQVLEIIEDDVKELPDGADRTKLQALVDECRKALGA
jgi:hypothetical protein